MAKIICVTTGLTGILNASFELVNRLEKSGHEIIYASPRKVKEKVEAQGITFFQLPEISLTTEPELPPLKGKFRKLARLTYKYQNATERRAAALHKTEPTAFSGFLDEVQPDLVLIDVELHEYIFKTYGKKIPMVLLSQWFSLWNRKGLPYLLTDIIPGRGWRGHPVGMAISWQRIKIKRWFAFTKKKWMSGGTDRRSSLLALAKKENFPLSMIRENYWPGPFTYATLPVLSMTIQELEFPHEVRPDLYYVGAMVKENRVAPPLERTDKERLTAALKYKKDQQAALIYCSVSTLSEGDIYFIKKIIAAVKDQPNWMLVLSTGALRNKNYLAELPENVFAFTRVPQLEILKVADCSVNHGGIHTINECIHFQVPMLVYSGKRSDQNGCAARVAYHQLGMMADKDQDDVKTVRNKIREILGNQKYRTSMAEMHQHYLKYKEDKILTSVIEKFTAKKEI